VLGDALIQPIKEIVSQYLFGDQAVDVRLSEISEDAVAIGAAIYVTTRWLEKKITELVYTKSVIGRNINVLYIFDPANP